MGALLIYTEQMRMDEYLLCLRSSMIVSFIHPKCFVSFMFSESKNCFSIFVTSNLSIVSGMMSVSLFTITSELQPKILTVSPSIL